ncbi:MAG: hypothetical protein AAGC95_11310 [Pseudomonadota bacterium]
MTRPSKPPPPKPNEDDRRNWALAHTPVPTNRDGVTLVYTTAPKRTCQRHY